MKKILTVLFLLHFTLPSFSDEPGVISLMYHRVGEGKYPSTNVSTEMFKQHLEAIKASGLSYIEPEKFKNQIPKISADSAGSLIGLAYSINVHWTKIKNLYKFINKAK